MLNGPDDSPIKNYKYLASECQVSSDLYQSLQPLFPESPTALVLEEIVSQRPTFTVEQLLANLRDMDRVDAIQGISSYFVGKKVVYSSDKQNAFLFLFLRSLFGLHG